MISQSGAYSRLVNPGTVLAFGQEQVPQPGRPRLRLQAFEERHRLPSVAFIDFCEQLFLVRIDVLDHEGLDTLLQLLDLLRMLKLHGGTFLEGATIVSYDVSVALPIGGSPSIACWPGDFTDRSMVAISKLG
jgi:hypothetical protein